jgi:hypothetical protein
MFGKYINELLIMQIICSEPMRPWCDHHVMNFSKSRHGL